MKTLAIICRFLAVSWIVICDARAGEALRVALGNGVTMDLVEIPPGVFEQGSPPDEAGRSEDEVGREVTISQRFLIGRTAVTREQWERFVEDTGYRSEAETGGSGGFGWDGSALVQKKQFNWRDPGFSQTSAHPVCIVTYPDALAFCSWVERTTKRKTTLPTEAQWEYACRAGSPTPWHAGVSASQFFWHKGNAGNTTHPVNDGAANAWGLVIGGNVSEWCLDWYGPYQSGPLTDPRQDNPNLSDKPRRVLRGGSWNRDAKNTRSAARWRSDPRSRNADIGFRIVCSAELIAPPPTPKPVPKVEADPGEVTPVQMPPPLSHQVPVPQPRLPGPSSDSGVGGFFGGLLCLLIPIGLMVLFVRIIAGHGKKQTNPFVSPSPASMPPPRVGQSIRKTEDGFWVRGDWPVGTPLKLRYMVGGVAGVLDMRYRPGPDGQFVFTGGVPESVSVVPEGDEGIPLPPPLFQETMKPREDRDERETNRPRPPVFPSAY